METLSFNNVASYTRFLAIADKIESDPTLLAVPLANIDRWLAADHDSPHRLKQWREIILNAQKSTDSLSALLDLLRDDSEEARHIKSFSPFPGILTRTERDILSCGFSH